MFTQFLGGPIDEKRDIYALASPVTHVTSGGPPLLLVHGELDQTVPFNQSELMHQACQRNGVETTLIKVTGADHGFQQFAEKSISPALPEIEQANLDFFIKHLL